VDPVEFKRRNALEMGATHAAASMEAAFPIVAELTRGLMADKVIMTPSLLLGELMEPANMLTRKGGTIVATAVAPTWQTDITFNLFSFAMSNKTLKGTLYGQSNPRYDVPRVLDLYRDGLIKLDEMITQTYALADVNKGYKDMRDGLNIRGVIVYE
jgi:S-(hydroxymethyl)glutathione dehydrogenase/alcohol dehydrogenase